MSKARPRTDPPHPLEDLLRAPGRDQSHLAETDEWLPDAPLWPAPPAAAVYHGLAGELVRRIEPQSEADPVAILIQLLVIFGAALGRTAHFRVEEDQHYGNLFACLVGETARGRKGTSAGRAWKAFEALAETNRPRLASGLASGEGLVWAVRDERWEKQQVKSKGRVVDYQLVLSDEGVRDKRLLISESEFVLVLRVGSRQGNTLSARLREAWDTGNLNLLTKTNAAKATGAHIAVVGHITRAELARSLTETDTLNGFANRFIWLAVRRSKLLPLGGSPVDLADLSHAVARAVEAGQQQREIPLDRDAADSWQEELYPRLTEPLPGPVGAVTARAEAQVRRLALLYTLLDGAPATTIDHLQAAAALWDYAVRSCLWAFGDSTGHPDADLVMDALRQAPEGLTLTEISCLFGRHKRARELRDILAYLETARLVLPGRPATGRSPSVPWRIPVAGVDDLE